MNVESRTEKSIKNSLIALGMYFVNLILQFFSRKIFLNYLGSEILGLNTTATNLLQFLNLAELGIGAAIGFTLYKPLYQKDTIVINEILTLQGWYYKRIACIVILGSIVLMVFFPLIFAKISLPLWYAYASYSVILFSALLSYFFNYKQVLLSADQKDYKIQYSYKLIILSKISVQIIAVKFFRNPYIYWLVLEVIFAIIACISLSKTISKTYPYLEKSKLPINNLKSKHNILVKKIRQVFYHKIGGFALTQSSPLIIYAYANLSLVTQYGNYQIIVVALSSLMSSVFNSVGGGIGNLVASDDKKRILSVFNELFSIRFLIISTLCISFFILSPSIIKLWIGETYILPTSTLVIIIINMFFILNRSTVDNYISAYGLYGDIYAPLCEAILNIGLSVLFGYFWGLNGILLGVAISLFLVIFCWKPFYLFKKGIKIQISEYLMLLFKNFVPSVIGFVIIYRLSQTFTFSYVNQNSELFRYISYICEYFIICLIGQLFFKSGIELFIKRIKRLLNRTRA